MNIIEILDSIYPDIRAKDFYLLKNRNEHLVREEIIEIMKEHQLSNIDYYITISQLNDDVLIKL